MRIRRYGQVENVGPVPEMYCPQCGQQTIVRGFGDDYYVGSTHFCLSCKCDFTIQGPGIGVPWEEVE